MVNGLYCIANDDCIHRHGCKRWLWNYIEEPEEKTLIPNPNINCINDEPYPFSLLIRFRTSEKRGKVL